MLGAIVLFAVAALGGLVLATLRLSGKPLPLALALLHGALAASGIAALVMVALASPLSTVATVSLGLFVAAALGGFALFSFYLRKKELPIPLMVIHAVVAVGAFALLVAAFLKLA